MAEDERCVTDINCRIAQAKEAFSLRKELLSKNLRKQTKIKIVKTLVWTTLPARLRNVDVKKEGY